jgi:MraZ protein
MVRSGIKCYGIKLLKIMFIGEFTHTLDDKKRLSLPSKFRKELGKKVIITHGLDNCLFMFTLSQWDKIAEQLGNMSFGNADSRGFNRIMLGGAVEIEIDTAGRILIPDFLRQYAGVNVSDVLKDKDNAKLVFTGVHTRIEIWEEKKWKSYKEKILKQADSLASKLSSIGAI